MAPTSDSDPYNSDNINTFVQKNSTMEKCCVKSNADLALTIPTSSKFEEKFYRKLIKYDDEHQGSHRKPWIMQRVLEVIEEIKSGRETMEAGRRRTPMEYYWMNKYDVVTTDTEEYLILKTLALRIIPREQYFEILTKVHESCGHRGRDRILNEIKNKYYIPKKAVEIFVSLCPTCETKRKVLKKGIVSKSIVSHDNDNSFNTRGQVDLINFESCPDGEFKWLLNYQDIATKFLNLRPLKTNNPKEVACELKKIFLTFGAPNILQYDDRELTANVIKELVAMWPDCKIIHGSHHSYLTQDSVEKSSLDVENMLRTWMTEKNCTNWSFGCFIVQYLKNSSNNRFIDKSPYKALFGSESKTDLKVSLISTILSNEETEEQMNITVKQEPAEAMCDEATIYLNNDTYNLNIKIENIETENIEHVHNDTTDVCKCESCKNTVEEMFETNVNEESVKNLNVICYDEQDINTEGNKAQKGVKRPAEGTIENAVKKLPYFVIGNSVSVKIPKADRGSKDTKYIQGKIVDIRNGVYKIGTKIGTIKNWFAEKDLQFSDLNYDEEISESPINLSEAVDNQTPDDGPKFHNCSCKPAVNQCHNNRCACYKNKILCGSECHQSLSCINI